MSSRRSERAASSRCSCRCASASPEQGDERNRSACVGIRSRTTREGVRCSRRSMMIANRSPPVIASCSDRDRSRRSPRRAGSGPRARAKGAWPAARPRARAGEGLPARRDRADRRANRVKAVVGRLKRHPDTRHVPALVIGEPAVRTEMLRAGAAAFVERPADRAALDAALAKADRLRSDPSRRVALVATHEGTSDHALAPLAEDGQVEVQLMRPQEALPALQNDFRPGGVAIDEQDPRSAALLSEIALVARRRSSCRCWPW